MVIKLLTKVGVSGGAMAGAMVGVDPKWINGKETRELPKEEFKISANQINTLEDIDIFAKQNGCSFAFVNSWGRDKKTVNRAEQFIKEAGTQAVHNEANRSVWTSVMVQAVKTSADKCKNNSVLVFSNPGLNNRSLELKFPGQG